jgi:integrase
LLEADGLQTEPLDAAPIDFYRPNELRALLENSNDQMRAIIALQAFAGLRLQETLRLDWREVFGVAGSIEVSTAKSKNRQRRLVDICPALEHWLAPYRRLEGKVAIQTLNGYTAAFTTLRRTLKIPSRRNGLRHGFVTYHFALHQNENAISAMAGNSPAMIHAHYKGLATKAEAKKWFGVLPPKSAKNAIQLTVATARA